MFTSPSVSIDLKECIPGPISGDKNPWKPSTAHHRETAPIEGPLFRQLETGKVALRLVSGCLKQLPGQRLFSQAHRTITRVNFRLLRDFRFLPGDHLIEQLPDEAKRIDLIVMLAGREA